VTSMNRTTFLFLALLIASCIVTVNSRHEARTLITQKTVLAEKVTSLQESIRRLELANARFSAKTCPLPAEAPVSATQHAAVAKPPAAPGDSIAPPRPAPAAHPAQPAAAKLPAPAPAHALPAHPLTPSKVAISKDEDALSKMMDKASRK
jgi:uncharacterized membrane protein